MWQLRDYVRATIDDPHLRVAQLLWLCGCLWPFNVLGGALVCALDPRIPPLWRLIPLTAPVCFYASAWLNPHVAATEVTDHALNGFLTHLLFLPGVLIGLWVLSTIVLSRGLLVM